MAIQLIFKNRFGSFVINNEEKKELITPSELRASIYEFQTFETKVLLDESTDFLHNLKRGNEMRLLISSDQSIYTERFAGEIAEIEITQKEDKSREVLIRTQSPFIRLEKTFLDQVAINCSSGFRRLMKDIISIGKIWGRIVFDDDVADDIEIGFLHNYPAFSLLKQICLQRDLVFNIKKGYILRISNRMTSIKEKESNIKNINLGDMETWTIKK